MIRTVPVPSSKSLTHRALLCAAAANGVSRIVRPCVCDDTLATIRILASLGASFSRSGDTLLVRGFGGAPRCPVRVLCDVGASGTTLRLLTSFCAAGRGDYVFRGTARMAERPVAPLLGALRTLGAAFPPAGADALLALSASGLRGGDVEIDCSGSGQFLSAILLAAPLADAPTHIAPTGPVVSRPYVRMTVDMMRRFGVYVRPSPGTSSGSSPSFDVVPQSYAATEVAIGGDWSSAAVFLAYGALNSPTAVSNLVRESTQADAVLPGILHSMGATTAWRDDVLTVSPAPLRAVSYDLTDCPDLLPVLAVLCAHANGRSVLTGLAHVRGKESDRVRAMAEALASCGVAIEEAADALAITGLPDPAHGPSPKVTLRTRGDHRLAMAFALLDGGGMIDDPDCVAKSCPEFPALWTNLTK